MDIESISNHIYNDSIPQAIQYVRSITDEETLFVYAYNYNWDNGFEVPEAILKNATCSLSVALLLFSSSDGFLYLEDKQTDSGTNLWHAFITNLYNKVLQNKFPRGTVAFDPQLSKVQEFKLKKVIAAEETVFIVPIEGKDCYTNI